jgi:hypothetical protein
MDRRALAVTLHPVMKKLLVLALAIPLASVASAAPKAPMPARLVTKRPVTALAADGGRAALIIRGRRSDELRWQVLVWEPASHRLRTIHTERHAYPGFGVALSGTRGAWDDCSPCAGNTLTTRVSSATLARRSAVSLGSDDGTELPSGGEVLAPSGDGKLLAYTDQLRCDENGDYETCPSGREPGEVVEATIWRAAPRGPCPASFSDGDSRRPGHCARVATAHGRLTVLDVDAGRIAARTDHGVRLLTGAGRRLLDVPLVNVSGAALSGNRLAVKVPGAIEILDAGSGELLATIPAQSGDRLEDLKAGIFVTANGKTVTLRRLSDGHTVSLPAAGYARARLEGAGLFIAGGRRVTFTPMADVRRILEAASLN